MHFLILSLLVQLLSKLVNTVDQNILTVYENHLSVCIHPIIYNTTGVETNCEEMV